MYMKSTIHNLFVTQLLLNWFQVAASFLYKEGRAPSRSARLARSMCNTVIDVRAIFWYCSLSVIIMYIYLCVCICVVKQGSTPIAHITATGAVPRTVQTGEPDAGVSQELYNNVHSPVIIVPVIDHGTGFNGGIYLALETLLGLMISTILFLKVMLLLSSTMRYI